MLTVTIPFSAERACVGGPKIGRMERRAKKHHGASGKDLVLAYGFSPPHGVVDGAYGNVGLRTGQKTRTAICLGGRAAMAARSS